MDNYIFDPNENITRTPVSAKYRYGIQLAENLGAAPMKPARNEATRIKSLM